jgi:hypothetical protein
MNRSPWGGRDALGSLGMHGDGMYSQQGFRIVTARHIPCAGSRRFRVLKNRLATQIRRQRVRLDGRERHGGRSRSGPRPVPGDSSSR